jgi:hypothetical protein
MTTRGAAELARLKIRYPLWEIACSGAEYSASRGSMVISARSAEDLDAQIHDHDQPMSASGALAREFREWTVQRHPSGCVSAWWVSADGTERHLVVERTSADLLTALRAMEAKP